MFYPKVKFSLIPLRLEIELFYNFLFDHAWGWGKYIIKKHPRLEPVLLIKNKKERKYFIKRYLFDYRKSNYQKFLTQKKKYQAAWKKIEKRFMSGLSEILNTTWPENKKSIQALISINPICPRFLDVWSFSIFYGRTDSEAVAVMMHEVVHFLYFKKWSELFPEAQRKTFDSPYLEWHLSELLAPVILSDQRIQKVHRQKADFYKEHKKIKIGKKSAPEFFKDLYKKHLRKRTSFEQFLKEAYARIKKYRHLFNF